MPQGKLHEKIAIVTGGAHGIGRAICQRYAQEGAAVLISDIDAEAGEAVAADFCENAGWPPVSCRVTLRRKAISTGLSMPLPRRGDASMFSVTTPPCSVSGTTSPAPHPSNGKKAST
jgi:NAD(P)-dependent dehydrogenase (short-subunit alcohol dehydrogenase family)